MHLGWAAINTDNLSHSLQLSPRPSPIQFVITYNTATVSDGYLTPALSSRISLFVGTQQRAREYLFEEKLFKNAGWVESVSTPSRSFLPALF